MIERLRALAGSGVVHVAFAFVAMGGWAVFANFSHPMPKPLLAGLVQGTISAILTLCLKSIIDTLSRMFKGTFRLWAPPLVACLATSAILVALHARQRNTGNTAHHRGAAHRFHHICSDL